MEKPISFPLEYNYSYCYIVLMLSFLLSVSSSMNKGTGSYCVIDCNLSFELFYFAQIKYDLKVITYIHILNHKQLKEVSHLHCSLYLRTQLINKFYRRCSSYFSVMFNQELFYFEVIW